jgi:aminopeptidase YwaD
MKFNMYQIIPCIGLMFLLACNSGKKADSEISAEELRTHVSYLASDALEGRKPGSNGDSLAAYYIKEQYEKYGLAPIHSTCFQEFKILTEVRSSGNNYLIFNDKNYEEGIDFMPLAFSADTGFEGNVVFVGYGFNIREDSLQWNDYDGVDVKGKWLMIFRDHPEPHKDESVFAMYGEDRIKLIGAMDQKAAGVLFVNVSGDQQDDALMELKSDYSERQANIPVIHISRKLATYILGEQDISSLEKKLNEERKPLSFETGSFIKAGVSLERKYKHTRNVWAIIEASHPEKGDEYIIAGAHYDHLGMGGYGTNSRMPDTTAVHNGADDNASGVATLIEIAGKLQSMKKELKKSVIFVAFGAEEMGLLGSKYFVSHAPVDLGKVSAMINFDMMGRMDSTERNLFVGGTGTSMQFDSILSDHYDSSLFTLHKQSDGYGPSDHASFYAENIPVLFFSTGAHTDYHTPFDDIEKLNFRGQEIISKYACTLIKAIAMMDQKLVFSESGSKYRSKYSKHLKVSFGIMPDVTGREKKGLGVDAVRKGTPAALGGMQKGDIIVAINGEPVGDIYEYMSRLKKLRPGAIAIVEVLRMGEKKVLLLPL